MATSNSTRRAWKKTEQPFVYKPITNSGPKLLLESLGQSSASGSDVLSSLFDQYQTLNDNINQCLTDESNFSYNVNRGFEVEIPQGKNYIKHKMASPEELKKLLLHKVMLLRDKSRPWKKQPIHKQDTHEWTYWVAQALFYGIKVSLQKEDMQQKMQSRLERDKLRVPKRLKKLRAKLKREALELQDDDEDAVTDEDVSVKAESDDDDTGPKKVEDPRRFKKPRVYIDFSDSSSDGIDDDKSGWDSDAEFTRPDTASEPCESDSASDSDRDEGPSDDDVMSTIEQDGKDMEYEHAAQDDLDDNDTGDFYQPDVDGDRSMPPVPTNNARNNITPRANHRRNVLGDSSDDDSLQPRRNSRVDLDENDDGRKRSDPKPLAPRNSSSDTSHIQVQIPIRSSSHKHTPARFLNETDSTEDLSKRDGLNSISPNTYTARLDRTQKLPAKRASTPEDNQFTSEDDLSPGRYHTPPTHSSPITKPPLKNPQDRPHNHTHLDSPLQVRAKSAGPPAKSNPMGNAIFTTQPAPKSRPETVHQPLRSNSSQHVDTPANTGGLSPLDQNINGSANENESARRERKKKSKHDSKKADEPKFTNKQDVGTTSSSNLHIQQAPVVKKTGSSLKPPSSLGNTIPGPNFVYGKAVSPPPFNIPMDISGRELHFSTPEKGWIRAPRNWSPVHHPGLNKMVNEIRRLLPMQNLSRQEIRWYLNEEDYNMQYAISAIVEDYDMLGIRGGTTVQDGNLARSLAVHDAEVEPKRETPASPASNRRDAIDAAFAKHSSSNTLREVRGAKKRPEPTTSAFAEINDTVDDGADTYLDEDRGNRPPVTGVANTIRGREIRGDTAEQKRLIDDVEFQLGPHHGLTRSQLHYHLQNAGGIVSSAVRSIRADQEDYAENLAYEAERAADQTEHQRRRPRPGSNSIQTSKPKSSAPANHNSSDSVDGGSALVADARLTTLGLTSRKQVVQKRQADQDGHVALASRPQDVPKNPNHSAADGATTTKREKKLMGQRLPPMDHCNWKNGDASKIKPQDPKSETYNDPFASTPVASEKSQRDDDRRDKDRHTKTQERGQPAEHANRNFRGSDILGQNSRKTTEPSHVDTVTTDSKRSKSLSNAQKSNDVPNDRLARKGQGQKPPANPNVKADSQDGRLSTSQAQRTAKDGARSKSEPQGLPLMTNNQNRSHARHIRYDDQGVSYESAGLTGMTPVPRSGHGRREWMKLDQRPGTLTKAPNQTYSAYGSFLADSQRRVEIEKRNDQAIIDGLQGKKVSRSAGSAENDYVGLYPQSMFSIHGIPDAQATASRCTNAFAAVGKEAKPTAEDSEQLRLFQISERNRMQTNVEWPPKEPPVTNRQANMDPTGMAYAAAVSPAPSSVAATPQSSPDDLFVMGLDKSDEEEQAAMDKILDKIKSKRPLQQSEATKPKASKSLRVTATDPTPQKSRGHLSGKTAPHQMQNIVQEAEHPANARVPLDCPSRKTLSPPSEDDEPDRGPDKARDSPPRGTPHDHDHDDSSDSDDDDDMYGYGENGDIDTLRASQAAVKAATSVFAPRNSNTPCPLAGTGRTLATSPSQLPRSSYGCSPATARQLFQSAVQVPQATEQLSSAVPSATSSTPKVQAGTPDVH